MTRFLLDTNILSDLVRHPSGVVAKRIADVGQDNVFTSVIVAGELRFGAIRKASPRLLAQTATILGLMEILPVEHPIEEAYANLRTHLEKIGQLIGANDLWIAAHAVALDMILVTDNMGEFSRVPNLRIENWLRETQPS